MRIINKHITLDEIEIIRNSLDKLHEYHNSKSKFFSGDYPRITFEERIAEYKKNSKYGEYRIELLIESETDNILGFCIAYSKKVSGKIEVLFVDEKYRRNGLGLKLMNSAVEWFKEKQIYEIELTVVYGNEAVSFYQKLGFYPRSIIMTTKS
ncbi:MULTISPECIES: GNAT family N-acetyltransferase [Bacillus cereus group]|uniref:N-acetyltransferase n=1 Tax=Bacillus pseudomycoides TaxID=64104 RepID=A0AAJ3R8Y9_9BACI|nr:MULTISPECIES: GNAT family N-acetyltransferase [Bacillus cereus group]AIK39524.1 acetyltransferase domain protein [Bacillus pseudomycoides]AJI18993.1 acetyltransferase domain protein [Bacillus pseudomycoides]MBD5798724.1 GNAT family N-acetyltransferase [Bacillus pseudomycoides]MBJ8027242.1 GNAT family N-acetyltransferase [Bacillus cereus group sp. N21]MDR4329250.1 GNAT family N-acetyltransferase [Bacillus pseudomycoides]